MGHKNLHNRNSGKIVEQKLFITGIQALKYTYTLGRTEIRLTGDGVALFMSEMIDFKKIKCDGLGKTIS